MFSLASTRVLRDEEGSERSQRDRHDSNAALDLNPEIGPHLEITRSNVGYTNHLNGDHEEAQAKEEAYSKFLASFYLDT